MNSGDADTGPGAPAPPSSAGELSEAEEIPLFKSPAAVRFLGAQFASSLGDWIGLFAILALSLRLSQGTAFEVMGPGLVLITRTLPGFLFGQLAGPLVDRWNRKKVMVVCDVMRGLLIAVLPFVNSLALLMLNQLVFELATMLWQPAKEASVPDVVAHSQISKANSLGQMAAYGTFPLGALVFAGLAKAAQVMGELSFLKVFKVNQESLALFVDSGTFFLAAALVAGLQITSRRDGQRRFDFTLAIREIREGYGFIAKNRRVRTVIIGLAMAVFGAGSVVSLGSGFVQQDLSGGPSGFGVIMMALGTGAALGVLLTETAGRKLHRDALYAVSLLASGIALLLAASTSTLGAASVLVALAGFFAAPGYISGLTLVHQNAEEEFRGRSFAALLSLTRLSMMIALGLAPVIAGALGSAVADASGSGRVNFLGLSISLTGTRLALWLGGFVVIAAGVVAGISFWGGGLEEAPEEEAKAHAVAALGASSAVDPFHPSPSQSGVGAEWPATPGDGANPAVLAGPGDSADATEAGQV